MRELSLRELRDVELNLLNVFDAFCKKNNITYFISNGTLLGTVKYKGFIPWDDDIDVILPRADYDKLLRIFDDSERYRLFAFERNDKYLYPFAKLCDMATKKVEQGVDNGVDLGIDIDIFALDLWNSDIKKAKREAKYINRQIFFLGLSKADKAYSRTVLKRIVKSILMVYAKAMGSKHFIRNINLKSICENRKNSKYVGCKSWCIYGEREIIPSKAFSNTVEMEFEGKKIPAPIGYDTYLSSLYGDYKNDPPKDKQITHHSFKAYIR
jgi:lipopolysaccharide cholinephosphotransferase